MSYTWQYRLQCGNRPVPIKCVNSISIYVCNILDVSSGTFILLDEIMSSWLGLEADYPLNGIPHKTKSKNQRVLG